MFLVPKFFSMKVRKERGQHKIMNDKSDAFFVCTTDRPYQAAASFAPAKT